jgi:hypothetical protein
MAGKFPAIFVFSISQRVVPAKEPVKDIDLILRSLPPGPRERAARC